MIGSKMLRNFPFSFHTDSLTSIRDVLMFWLWSFLSITKWLTCFRRRSLLAERHVTKYFVRLKNDPKTSSVKWSRDERCSIKEMTKKPRFWKKVEIEIVSVLPGNIYNSLFYWKRWRRRKRKKNFHIKAHNTCIICCCTVCELSTSSQIKPSNLKLLKE